MKILLAASEAVPFAKTGGLADVCGALPLALAKLGHQPALIMPAYRQVLEGGFPLEPTGVELSIPIGHKTVAGRLLTSKFPGSDVPAYFVEQPQYFDRDHLYGSGNQDYRDNCERFVFFSRAVLEAIRLLKLDSRCLARPRLANWARCPPISRSNIAASPASIASPAC